MSFFSEFLPQMFWWCIYIYICIHSTKGGGGWTSWFICTNFLDNLMYTWNAEQIPRDQAPPQSPFPRSFPPLPPLQTRNDRGVGPLSLASDFGRADVVRLLLDAGAEMEERDSRGNTPLMHACQQVGKPHTRYSSSNGSLGYYGTPHVHAVPGCV